MYGIYHSISSVVVGPYANYVGAHVEATVDEVGDEATIRLHHSFGLHFDVMDIWISSGRRGSRSYRLEKGLSGWTSGPRCCMREQRRAKSNPTIDVADLFDCFIHAFCQTICL